MIEKKLPHDHGNTNEMGLYQALSKTDDFEGVSEVFKLLSDTNRLRIYWMLCHCEECVVNISVMLDMSSPAVSHHLKLLKDKGLISSRRDGKEVYYKVRDCEVSKLLHLVSERIMEMSCPKANSNECKMCGKCTDGKRMIMNSVHEYLVHNLDKRITIDNVAKKFLMNPTTLKEQFKVAYGTSIAAHVKEHRMKKAAELLIDTDESIAHISRTVGYENAGKFASTFKEFYGMTPKEFRK